MAGNSNIRILTAILLLLMVACGDSVPPSMEVDTLIRGGLLIDGSGSAPNVADIGISGDRISFIGDASSEGVSGREIIDARNRWVTPGFIDMHSHAELSLDYGRDAAPYLYQGITTAVLGTDGDGAANVGDILGAWESAGIGINGLLYVGHGAVREEAMGRENRAPTTSEFLVMSELVRQAMREGAFGLSTGLFYVPGTYATTEEVIELTRVAAEFEGAIYDTHDRDLGAVFGGVGFDASVKEGIRIAEEAGVRAIFSHFNPQGAHNYGRADVAARYINDARQRGVDVWAAQHPYTATQSTLRSYLVPAWAASGGHAAMVERFDDTEQNERIVAAMQEMLKIRGGAEKIWLVDDRPEINGITLAQYAAENEMSVAETVQAILRVDNATVMNLELYDFDNTRRLAQEEWMMTCTDGRTPRPDQAISHPRTFGAFPMKFRSFVVDEPMLSEEFVIRSFTGLAADFLRLPDRGYLRESYVADIVVIDPKSFRDRASIEQPRLLSEGVELVLVGGQVAIKDGALSGTLAGTAIRRPLPGTEIQQ